MHTNKWYLALAAAILYCLNQWMAISGLYFGILVMVSILWILILCCASGVLPKSYYFYICFLCLLGFPEYSPDPYLLEYISPFSFAKYPAMLSMMMMMRIKIRRMSLILSGMLIISTFNAFIIEERIGNFSAELPYVLLFLIAFACNTKIIGRVKYVWLESLEAFFYLLLPISIFSMLVGIYEHRSEDTTTFYYGHWLCIVSVIAIYRLVSNKSTLLSSWGIRAPLAIFILYICSASYQSIHFILLAATIFIALFEKKERSGTYSLVYKMALLLLFVIIVYSLITRINDESWLYFKFAQIGSLINGTFGQSSNSVTIRIAQLQSLFQQSDYFSIIFGRGVASTYMAVGEIWDSVVFHHATYPMEQIESGSLQYIHESITMIIKWIGLMGMVFVFSEIFYFSNRSGRVLNLNGILRLLFLSLFASSLQTGIIVTMLYVFLVSSNDVV